MAGHLSFKPSQFFASALVGSADLSYTSRGQQTLPGPSEQLLLWVPLEQLEGQAQLSPLQSHSSLWPRDLIQPTTCTAAFILHFPLPLIPGAPSFPSSSSLS